MMGKNTRFFGVILLDKKHLRLAGCTIALQVFKPMLIFEFDSRLSLFALTRQATPYDAQAGDGGLVLLAGKTSVSCHRFGGLTEPFLMRFYGRHKQFVIRWIAFIDRITGHKFAFRFVYAGFVTKLGALRQLAFFDRPGFRIKETHDAIGNDARSGDDLFRLIHQLRRQFHSLYQTLLGLLDALTPSVLKLFDRTFRLANDCFCRLDDSLRDLVDFLPTFTRATAQYLGDGQDFLFDFRRTVMLD